METDKIAVIKTGGRQHKICENDTIKVNKLDGKIRDKVKFADILNGQNVEGEVIEQKKDKKVLIFKHHKRKRYTRKKGHRQEITLLKINKIGLEKEK